MTDIELLVEHGSKKYCFEMAERDSVRDEGIILVRRLQGKAEGTDSEISCIVTEDVFHGFITNCYENGGFDKNPNVVRVIQRSIERIREMLGN